MVVLLFDHPYTERAAMTETGLPVDASPSWNTAVTNQVRYHRPSSRKTPPTGVTHFEIPFEDQRLPKILIVHFESGPPGYPMTRPSLGIRTA